MQLVWQMFLKASSNLLEILWTLFAVNIFSWPSFQQDILLIELKKSV